MRHQHFKLNTKVRCRKAVNKSKNESWHFRTKVDRMQMGFPLLRRIGQPDFLIQRWVNQAQRMRLTSKPGKRREHLLLQNHEETLAMILCVGSLWTLKLSFIADNYWRYFHSNEYQTWCLLLLNDKSYYLKWIYMCQQFWNKRSDKNKVAVQNQRIIKQSHRHVETLLISRNLLVDIPRAWSSADSFAGWVVWIMIFLAGKGA